MSNEQQMRQFFSEFAKLKKEVDDLQKIHMPKHAGRIAVNHFNENFEKGGFVNNGLHKWKKSNRELHGGKSATSQYKTLHSSRNQLLQSIRYTPGEGRVVIATNEPHAPIHNWGGTLNPTVTPKMRKFAWAKFFAAGGNNHSPSGGDGGGGSEAQFWKRLALTKKTKLTIRMPQRQFLGESKELDNKLRAKLDEELEKLATRNSQQ